MKKYLKILFIVVIVRPVVMLLLGLNTIGREQLPLKGPAVIVANHNSHLDTMVLLSLFPLSILHKVRPVAAADYFLRNRWMAWLSLNCIGIIPLNRSGIATKESLFADCHKALDNKEILIIFPEGSRGDPEQMGNIRKGVYHLVKDRGDTNVIPIVMHGLGRALPRGESLLVPFNCDVVIGPRLPRANDSNRFIENLAKAFSNLFEDCITKQEA